MATAEEIAQELKKVIENTVTDLSINMTAELIEKTPVDLGWARANWVPAIGRPGDSSDVNTPAQEQITSQKAKQQQAIGQLTSYQLGNGPVFISNNVPYISVLNNGSSTQAPKGYVQRAIADGVKKTVR